MRQGFALLLLASLLLPLVLAQEVGLPSIGAILVELVLTLVRSLFYLPCFLSNDLYQESIYEGLPRRDDYTNVLVPAEEVLNKLTPNAEGPITMHGIFWLHIQTVFAEAVSFAKTPEGGGLSEGFPLKSTNPAYRMRVIGDNWASTGFPLRGMAFIDGTVNFNIAEGTIDDPVKFVLATDARIPGTCLRIMSGNCLDFFLDWNMTIMSTPETVADGRPPHPKYPTSVVWLRESKGSITFDYGAIQIADAAGNPLQPAFDDFVADVKTSALFGNLWKGDLNPDRNPPWCVDGPWWCFWCNWLNNVS